MDFEELRAYIADSNIIPKAKLNNKNCDAIFLYEKPEGIKADKFIVYSFNEINGGGNVRHFLITLKLHSTDVLSLIDLKEGLIKLLDFSNRPVEITKYSKLVFSNDGGIYYNENTKDYSDNLYFECKIL